MAGPVIRFALAMLAFSGAQSWQAATAQPSPACASLAAAIKAQPPGPVFLASYPTVTSRPLQGAAFLYDNAVAVIALGACGEAREAARIGDAMLAALARDRHWRDGRLRNGYLAGSVGPGPLKLAGWWDAKQNMWVEDRYQAGSDTGNMAWAMLALLSLDRATGDRRYGQGAQRIGGWLRQRRDPKEPGGFTGGTLGHEPAPVVWRWKSTEHNADLAAAFTGLAQAAGDQSWRMDARAAETFVQAMWRPECGCFAAGTGEDGATRNPYLALDAQVWPLLAIAGAATRYRAAMTQEKLRAGDGFSYGEAKAGFWTEGTAQMALLLALAGRDAEAARLLKAAEAMRAPGGSYYAADAGALPTGFMLDTDPTQPRQYFRIPHLAALSWVALAQQRYNPFTGTRALP